MAPTIVGMLVLGAVVLLVLRVNDRQKERHVRRSEQEGSKPPSAYLNYQTRSSGILVVVVTAVVTGVVISGNGKPAKVPAMLPGPLERTRQIIGVTMAVAFVGLFAVIAFQRWKHRERLQALRMAQAGDIDGAVEFMQRLLCEKKASALLLNDLAVILTLQKHWEDALRLLELAEQCSDWNPLMLANKGHTLHQIGRLAEALPLLEDAYQRSSKELAVVCNFGSILADLERGDEALELLRHADHLFATQPGGSSDNPRCREKMLDELRQKVAGRSLL